MAILGVIFGFGGIIIDQQRDTFLKNFYELVPRIHLHPSSWWMHREKMSESKAFVFFCWTLNILGRLIWELPMMALFWGELLAGEKCCLYGGQTPNGFGTVGMIWSIRTPKEKVKLSNRHSSHTQTAKMSDQSKKTIYIYSFWEISTFLLPPQNTQPFSPRETTWAKKNIVTIWVKTCCYSFCARLPPSTTAPWSGKPVIATRSNEGRSNPLGKLPGIGGVFVGGGATVWMYKTL